MKLVRNEKVNMGGCSQFKTATECIEHSGIFLAKETKHTLVYYIGCDWHKGKPRTKYKVLINVKTGDYKCWRLSRMASAHKADFCDNYMR